MSEKKVQYAPSERGSPISAPKRTINRNPNMPLTGSQILTLINGIDILEDLALIRLGIDTGPRVSEVAVGESKEKGKRKSKTPGILVSNIDQDLGIIRIWDEKGNKNRILMPSQDTMIIIRMYLNERKKKDARLFPFTVKTAERKIQKWTKRLLGVTRSWHSLRTTYITRCAELGQSLKIVQENTGDKVRTLLQYYTKLSPDARRKMTQALPVIPSNDDKKTET